MHRTRIAYSGTTFGANPDSDSARKHGRVVQIGAQRKSAPHLIDAKEQIVEAALLGKISHVDMCCYYHMRANGNPPVEPVPDFLDYEMWTGPAPLRPYDGLPHLRWWRTFREYGNGLGGDMRVLMLNFLAAIESRGKPVADIEEGHTSTASCILANMAMDLGRTLSYDPEKRIVTGDTEATTKLIREYRWP